MSCLKETKIKLELLTDFDMLHIYENGIRGGITRAIKIYAEATNKYMKNFDLPKSSFFLYSLSTFILIINMEMFHLNQ